MKNNYILTLGSIHGQFQTLKNTTNVYTDKERITELSGLLNTLRKDSPNAFMNYMQSLEQSTLKHIGTRQIEGKKKSKIFSWKKK